MWSCQPAHYTDDDDDGDDHHGDRDDDESVSDNGGHDSWWSLCLDHSTFPILLMDGDILAQTLNWNTFCKRLPIWAFQYISGLGSFEGSMLVCVDIGNILLAYWQPRYFIGILAVQQRGSVSYICAISNYWHLVTSITHSIWKVFAEESADKKSKRFLKFLKRFCLHAPIPEPSPPTIDT